MYHYTVQDFQPDAAGCVKCCCERINLKPGTTTKILVGYAPWVVPIGQLHCAPQFSLEQLATCPAPMTGNLPPQLTDVTPFNTPVNVQLNGDLKTKITDPESAALTFGLLSLYGPHHGKLSVAADGLFSYIPVNGYTGEDRFYVSASDGSNKQVFEVMLSVGSVITMVATPHLSVGAGIVDQRWFNVSFPVTMSPAAQPCEIWKLTVLQAALDCDCTCFTRTDCFDIGVASC